MTYTKQTWMDDVSSGTAITKDKLNHIEQGIYDNSQALSKLRITQVDTGYDYIENTQDGKTASMTIYFHTTFEYVPIVMVTPHSIAADNVSMTVNSITTEKFVVHCYRSKANTTSFMWVAFN